MQIDWWTLGFQAINALILVWLLSRFLFEPVARIIAKRQAAADAILAAAETERSAGEAAHAKAEAEADELAANRGEILKEAAAEAEARKAKLISEARAAADKLIADAKEDIARAHRIADQAASERASELAVDIAVRLLDRIPDEVRITGFIDGLASGVASLPDDVRSGLASGGEPLRLIAARALTAAEEDRCREALGKALEGEVDVDCTVDADLIAGLELHGQHAEVRNSFRADLARIANELRADDDHRS